MVFDSEDEKQLAFFEGLVKDPRTSLNMQDNDGNTPLHEAVLLDHGTIVQLLLESQRTDTDIKNHDGCTPLHYAMAPFTEFRTAEMFLEKRPGTDINAKCKLGESPLQVACRFGLVDRVELLLTKKADPNSTSNDGMTPLHIACKNGNLEMVKLLIKNGANISKNGVSSMHLAAHNNHCAVVLYLLRKFPWLASEQKSNA